MATELYTSPSCPHCAHLRERLEWDGVDYVEHDVDADPLARRTVIALVGPGAMVPVLVEDGRVVQIGVDGRGCSIGAA